MMRGATIWLSDSRLPLRY